MRLAVVGALAVLAFSAPVAAGFAATPPPIGYQRVWRLSLGATFTVNGRTGAAAGAHRATGLVVVRGRWDGGAWRLVTTTRTAADGRYRLTVKPGRRGVFALRITPPDELAYVYVLHVV